MPLSLGLAGIGTSLVLGGIISERPLVSLQTPYADHWPLFTKGLIFLGKLEVAEHWLLKPPLGAQRWERKAGREEQSLQN